MGSSSSSNKNTDAPAVDANLPVQIGDWRVSHDKDGEEFFWHVVTRETTWDPPEEYEKWYDEQAELEEQPADTKKEEDEAESAYAEAAEAAAAAYDAGKDEDVVVSYFQPASVTAPADEKEGGSGSEEGDELQGVEEEDEEDEEKKQRADEGVNYSAENDTGSGEPGGANADNADAGHNAAVSELLDSTALAALAGVPLPPVSETAAVTISQSHYTPKLLVVRLNQVRAVHISALRSPTQSFSSISSRLSSSAWIFFFLKIFALSPR